MYWNHDGSLPATYQKLLEGIPIMDEWRKNYSKLTRHSVLISLGNRWDHMVTQYWDLLPMGYWVVFPGQRFTETVSRAHLRGLSGIYLCCCLRSSLFWCTSCLRGLLKQIINKQETRKETSDKKNLVKMANPAGKSPTISANSRKIKTPSATVSRPGSSTPIGLFS